MIDLVCYRRHGHNEADEPAATQPVMYRVIRQLKTTRQCYAEKLIQQQMMTAEQVDAKIRQYRDAMDAGQNPLPPVSKISHPYADVWQKHVKQFLNTSVDTRVDLKIVQSLAQQLWQLPEGFQLQPQVAKVIEEQRKMANGELPCTSCRIA